MEYWGPGYSDEGPEPEPSFSEKMNDLLVAAHPFVIPFIIMGIGLCLAFASESLEKKGGNCGLHEKAACAAQAAERP